MDFQYSDVVDPSTYETDGLCDGIPLRIHKDPMGEINGAVRCQKDWSERVSHVANYKGTLGTPFSFIRTSIPETLPDRLEIVSYANEFAFIYDGE
jgi:fusicocca-2,10(14)-diene synthase